MMEKKGRLEQTEQSQKAKVLQGSYQAAFDSSQYRTELEDRLPKGSILEFTSHPDGPTNLDYIVAHKDGDLSRMALRSLSLAPEERAYRLLEVWAPMLIADFSASPSINILLKHTLKSSLGSHCVFGLEYMGFEIEEHSFVIHLDTNHRVVMVCCTYLPNLRRLLSDARELKFESISQEKVKESIRSIGEYDRADTESLWMMIWDEQSKTYQVAPGQQIKLSLPPRRIQTGNMVNVVGITENREKPLHTAPGLPERRVGLGEILRDFPELAKLAINQMGDSKISKRKRQAVLLDLDSTSELKGRYAAIHDELEPDSTEMNGVFLNQDASYFDRVNAYYHLDYIQRYFREKLGLHVLDDYLHLNPVRLFLASDSSRVAYYDVIMKRIYFYKLDPASFTAVRDPRMVYHEYVHVVTDAIARLHRAGRLLTPRAPQALQAQAMDEGMSDYFACSLAAQRGARKALFYYRGANSYWIAHRNLRKPQQIPAVTLRELSHEASWLDQKYKLGEWWGHYLWQLRYLLGADIADLLIVHSIFFLSRWASFRQGRDALRLADRLLLDGKHEKTIKEKYEQVISEIEDHLIKVFRQE